MKIDQPLGILLNHIATLFERHNSDIARCAVAELKSSVNCPVVKQPQRIAQCHALDDLLVMPSSPSLMVLADTQQAIHWADSGGAAKPNAVQRRLAFAELIGPNGMIVNANCRVGLFLQCARTIYPAHEHAAEELFLVLSGTALWQRNLLNSTWHSPGSFVHHASWESHAMTSEAEPMLAVWCWIGDIRFNQYRLTNLPSNH